MEKTEITTVGTLYLGGQQHGFRPGSVVPVPASHAAELRAAGHTVEPKPAPAEAVAEAPEVASPSSEPPTV